MFDVVKFLRSERKGAKGSFITNHPELRGSSKSGQHDPMQPKIDMFPDPDLKCISREAIGRYGAFGDFTPFPLILLRAAHVVSQELFHRPLECSLVRRVNKDGSFRQVYSQQREARAKVAATLIMHTNLEYGMIGKIGNDGKFYHMSLEEIASHAGIGYERTKRAMTAFRRKGAMKIGKQYEEKADKVFEGHNSIRYLTEGFWAMFGFGDWMKAELGKRRKARNEQTAGMPDTEDTALLMQPYKTKRESVMEQMQVDANVDRLKEEIKKLNIDYLSA